MQSTRRMFLHQQETATVNSADMRKTRVHPETSHRRQDLIQCSGPDE